MKKSLFLLLIFLIGVTVAYGQQRSLAPYATLPPGSAGPVTLSLPEYDHLVELAARKPKPADVAPLPFVLSRAAFKLRVEEQTLMGTVEIEGNVLQKGPTKVPLTSG